MYYESDSLSDIESNISYDSEDSYESKRPNALSVKILEQNSVLIAAVKQTSIQKLSYAAVVGTKCNKNELNNKNDDYKKILDKSNAKNNNKEKKKRKRCRKKKKSKAIVTNAPAPVTKTELIPLKNIVSDVTKNKEMVNSLKETEETFVKKVSRWSKRQFRMELLSKDSFAQIRNKDSKTTIATNKFNELDEIKEIIDLKDIGKKPLVTEHSKICLEPLETLQGDCFNEIPIPSSNNCPQADVTSIPANIKEYVTKTTKNIIAKRHDGKETVLPDLVLNMALDKFKITSFEDKILPSDGLNTDLTSLSVNINEIVTETSKIIKTKKKRNRKKTIVPDLVVNMALDKFNITSFADKILPVNWLNTDLNSISVNIKENVTETSKIITTKKKRKRKKIIVPDLVINMAADKFNITSFKDIILPINWPKNDFSSISVNINENDTESSVKVKTKKNRTKKICLKEQTCVFLESDTEKLVTNFIIPVSRSNESCENNLEETNAKQPPQKRNCSKEEKTNIVPCDAFLDSAENDETKITLEIHPSAIEMNPVTINEFSQKYLVEENTATSTNLVDDKNGEMLLKPTSSCKQTLSQKPISNQKPILNQKPASSQRPTLSQALTSSQALTPCQAPTSNRKPVSSYADFLKTPVYKNVSKKCTDVFPKTTINKSKMLLENEITVAKIVIDLKGKPKSRRKRKKKTNKRDLVPNTLKTQRSIEDLFITPIPFYEQLLISLNVAIPQSDFYDDYFGSKTTIESEIACSGKAFLRIFKSDSIQFDFNHTFFHKDLIHDLRLTSFKVNHITFRNNLNKRNYPKKMPLDTWSMIETLIRYENNITDENVKKEVLLKLLPLESIDYDLYKFIFPIANWIHNLENKHHILSPFRYLSYTLELALFAIHQSSKNKFSWINLTWKHFLKKNCYNEIDMFLEYDITFDTVNEIINKIETNINIKQNKYFENDYLLCGNTLLKNNINTDHRQLFYRKYVRDYPSNYLIYLSYWKLMNLINDNNQSYSDNMFENCSENDRNVKIIKNEGNDDKYSLKQSYLFLFNTNKRVEEEEIPKSYEIEPWILNAETVLDILHDKKNEEADDKLRSDPCNKNNISDNNQTKLFLMMAVTLLIPAFLNNYYRFIFYK